MADEIKKDILLNIDANMNNIDKQLKNLTKKLGSMKLSLDMDSINAKNIKLIENLSKALSDLPISKEVTITPKISLGKFDSLKGDNGKLLSEKKRVQALVDEKFGDVTIAPKFNLRAFEKQLKAATKLKLSEEGLNLDIALNTSKAEKKLDALATKIASLGTTLKQLSRIDINIPSVTVEQLDEVNKDAVKKAKKGNKKASQKAISTTKSFSPDEHENYLNAFRKEYGIKPKNLSQALNATVGINTGGKKGADLQVALEAAISKLLHQAQKEAYTNKDSDKAHVLNQLAQQTFSELFNKVPFYKNTVLNGDDPSEKTFSELLSAFKDYGFKLFHQNMDSQNNTLSKNNEKKRLDAINKIQQEIDALASGNKDVGLSYLNKDLATVNSSDLGDELKTKRDAWQSLLRGVKAGDESALKYLHNYMQGKIDQLNALRDSIFKTDAEATKGMSIGMMQSAYANKLVNDWVTLQEAKKHIADAIQRDLQNNDLDKWKEHTAKLEAIKAREKDPYDADIKKNLNTLFGLEERLNARRAAQDMIYGADSNDDAEIKYLQGLQSKTSNDSVKNYLQKRMEELGLEVQKDKEKTAKELIDSYQELVNEARKALVAKAKTPNADVSDEVNSYITANNKLLNAKQDNGKLGFGDSAQALSALATELDSILGKGNQYSEMLKKEAQANTDLLQTIKNNTDALKEFKNIRKDLAKNITSDVGLGDNTPTGTAKSAGLFQQFKDAINNEISAGQASGEPVNFSKFKNLAAQYADLYDSVDNDTIAGLYKQLAQEIEAGSKKIANSVKSTLDAEKDIIKAMQELDDAYQKNLDPTKAKANLANALSTYESAFENDKGTGMTANDKIRLLTNSASKADIQKDSDLADELNKQIEELRNVFGTTDAKIKKEVAEVVEEVKEEQKLTTKEIVEAIKALNSAYKNGLDPSSARKQLSDALANYETNYENAKGTELTANEKIRLITNSASKAGIEKDSEAAEELNKRIEELRKIFGTTDSKIQKGLEKEAEGQEKVNGLLNQYIAKLKQLDSQIASSNDVDHVVQLKKEYSALLKEMAEVGKASGEIKSLRHYMNILSDLAFTASPKTQPILFEQLKAANKKQAVQDVITNPDTRATTTKAVDALAYFIGLGGRASKGTGSALEAFSILMKDSARMISNNAIKATSVFSSIGGLSDTAGIAKLITPALGVLTGTIGTVIGGALTALTAWIGALTTATSIVQNFGGILVQLGQTLFQVLKPGIELYQSETQSTYSMMAAIASNTSYNGVRLRDMPDQEKALNLAFAGSKMIQDRAKLDAERGAFSYQEIIDALSGTLPVLLAKGMNMQQAYDINLGVASVAKLTHLAPGQVLQETRDLAQGSITAGHSQVANALGITNEDIKGDADEVWAFLMDRFEKYNTVLKEYAQTPVGAFEQMQDRFSIVAEEFVSNFAWSFKGVFDMITAWTGTWKDSLGRELTQIEDPSTGLTKDVWASFTTDENGNRVMTDYSDNPTGVPGFYLSDDLQNILEGLDDVFLHLAESADKVLGYFEELLDLNDVVGTGTDVINLLIDIVADAIMFIIWWIGTTKDWIEQNEALITTVLNIIIFIGKFIAINISAVKSITGFIGILNALVGFFINAHRKIAALLVGDIKGAKEIKPLEWLETNFKNSAKGWMEGGKDFVVDSVSLLPGQGTYIDGYSDIKNALMRFNNNNNNNRLTELWKKGQEAGQKAKEQQEKRRQQGVTDPGKYQGIKKEGSGDDAKAQRAAKQAENKAYKKYIAELKAALEAHVQALKDLADQNEIAYKEGFKSYADYASDKIKYQVEEAQAKVDELNAERSAIQNRSTMDADEKETALFNNQKELNKVNASLTKLVRAEEEIAGYLKQNSSDMKGIAASINESFAQAANMPKVNMDGTITTSSNVTSLEDLYKVNPQTFEEKRNWAMQRIMLGGYDENNAAAIVGNLIVESSLNPYAYDKGGHLGIGQWDANRWANENAFAQANSSDPYDFRTQVDYMLYEITQQSGNFFAQLPRAISDAVDEFGRKVERPGEEEIQRRHNEATYQANLAKDNYRPFVKTTTTGTNTGLSVMSGTFNTAEHIPDINNIDTEFDQAVKAKELVLGNLTQAEIDGLSASTKALVLLIARWYNWQKQVKVDKDGNATNFLWLTSGARNKGGHSGINLPYKFDIAADELESNPDLAKALREWLAKIGVAGVDEYREPSEGSTGGHFDINASGRNWKGSDYQGFDSWLASRGNSTLPVTKYNMATTKESHEVREHLLDARINFDELAAQYESVILGSVEARIDLVKAKYEKKRVTATPEEKELLDKLEQNELIKTYYEGMSQIVDFTTANYQTTLSKALSETDFRDVGNFDKLVEGYTKYFTELNNVEGMAVQNVYNALDRLEELYGRAQRLGFVAQAQEIDQKIQATLKSLFERYNDLGSKLDSNYDYMLKRFDNGSWTRLQSEQGHKEIEAYKNQAKAQLYHSEMIAMQSAYNQRSDEIAKLNKEAEELQKQGKNDEAQSKLDQANGKMKELNGLTKQLRDTHALEIMAEEGSHLKDALEDIRDTAKQALEDGLVTFMTDGVNSVMEGTKSIEEAFADMAISILKTIQKLCAENMIRTWMNQWFGTTSTTDLMQPFKYDPEANYRWSKNPDYVAQQADSNLKEFNRVGQYITNLPKEGTDNLKELYKKKKWIPEYASADLGITDVSANIVNVNAKNVEGLQDAVSAQTDNADTLKQISQNTAETPNTINNAIARSTVATENVANATLAEQVTNTAQNNISNSHLADIDVSTMQTASNTTAGGGAGGVEVEAPVSSIPASPMLPTNYASGLPTTGTLTNGGGGLLGGLGSSISNLADGILKPMESLVGDLSDFLNSPIFARGLNMVNSLVGSAGAQLGGSIFAISSLMNGDKKEQLLSLIYLELQLIFQYIMQIATAVQQLSSSLATASTSSGYATGGYISGAGTGTSDSIPAMLSNGEYVIKASSVKRYGTNFLNAVNNGNFAKIHPHIPKFADGGAVKSVTSSNLGDKFAGTLGSNISNTANLNVALVRDEQEAMSSFMRSPKGQRIMLDFSRKFANVTRRF